MKIIDCHAHMAVPYLRHRPGSLHHQFVMRGLTRVSKS